MNKRVAVVVLVSLGTLLGLGLAVVAPGIRDTDALSKQQTIEWLDNPRQLKNFSLSAAPGAFNNQSLSGRWTVVVFGFLNCPDICPTSLAELAQLANAVNEQAPDIKTPVNYLFVSVDPHRDSVVEVSEYAQYFHQSITGVTGAEDQLRRFAKDLGVQFKVTSDGEDYQVAHSITFSIIDPSGVFRGRFRPGFNPGHVVENLAQRLNSVAS